MDTNPPLGIHLSSSLTPLTALGRRSLLFQPPAPLTPLVDRQMEAALAESMLRRESVRLMTLTGPGGIGKTRLAIKVATDLRDTFSSGVFFIPLAALADAGLVAPTIADAIGLGEHPGASARETLALALRDAELLLVLDNFEHVLAAAPLLTDLLAVCPRLKILVTSRALLRVVGEQALPVPPLDLPDPQVAPSFEQLSSAPAVRLFVNRAQAVTPSFELTTSTAPKVAEICRLLDGLPLAIELAAAQSGFLPPTALLDRIEARLPLPFAGPRDVPARLRSVRDAVAWSYGLLSPDEQSLFRRVSVFTGGFGLAAAEAIGALPEVDAADVAGMDVLGRLALLVDKSLVQQESVQGAPRFSMLETICGFAREQLLASGEEDAIHRTHAEWYLALAERSREARFLPGGEHGPRRLAIEQANLRAAIDWLYRQHERDGLLRMATTLGRFWQSRGQLSEGCLWLERALDESPEASIHDRARARFELGQLLYSHGATARAEAMFDEILAILREHGDAVTQTGVLVWQGWIACLHGEYDRAERVLDVAIELAKSIPDPSVAASATAKALANLGLAAHGRGDLAVARERHDVALRAFRANGDVLGVMQSLRDRGDVARDQGDVAESFASYRECLAMLSDRGDLRITLEALEGVAMAAAIWDEPERAARLLGTAESVREHLGLALFVPADRVAHDRTVAIIASALGDERLRLAWSTGRSLSLSAAIEEVRAMTPPVTNAPETARRSAIKLSPREQDVLRLLADGHSDRQIAETLFISVRTAEAHVSRLLAKLGVPSRGAAVAAATAAGLVSPGNAAS